MRGALPVVLALILAGSGAAPPAVRLYGLQPAAAETNHAAIVVDTGSEVKKFCLAFPEDSISGAEALRRIDAQPVFASFGSRGEAVCSLCGTGCPSSDCFCDSRRFWFYHRAGPGGAPYTVSRAGASSTRVRNGDVEGWRWGAGEAPPPATVSEVCNVEEPPARSTAGVTGTSTTTTAGPTEEAPTTTAPPTPPAPAAPSTAAPPPELARPATGAATDPGPAEAQPGAEPEREDSAMSGVETQRGLEAEDGLAAPSGEHGDDPDGYGGSDLSAYAAFASLLATILIWKAKLRRSKVRPTNDQG